MKNKTLAIITASIIAAAALILTACLSLLHGSATVDVDYSSEISLDSSIDAEISDPVSASEESEAEESSETPIPDDTSATDIENTPDYPIFDYIEGDAKTVYIDGDDVANGVVIDVYSHKTGVLVGQLSFTSEEISRYIGELKSEAFNYENELWIVESEACVPLPEGDYRIEVYAGTWFAYTYQNEGIFELTQCTLTFAGGERLTGYIDMLIADLIADIEAGNVIPPDPETAVSKLLYRGLEGYWEGYYVEECDHYVPAAGRFCERFPYLIND